MVETLWFATTFGAPGSLVGNRPLSVFFQGRSPLLAPVIHRTRLARATGWRREALRSTLWVIPTALVVLAVVLFFACYAVDRAATDGAVSLPSWASTGGADAARSTLTTIAASLITVVGVVFSVTIVALTLASTQFGPRMLRNFIRDFGTQFTLGTFVATVVFAILALGSVRTYPDPEFVPHVAVTVALALTLVDLGVLIYFIHHVTKSIQLTQVVHGIARDLGRAIDESAPDQLGSITRPDATLGIWASVAELGTRLDQDGVSIPATTSGYLQATGHRQLVRIAERSNAVIRLVHRPGHFLVQGRPLATVWPADAEPAIAKHLNRAHVVGPHRTLFQDLQFAIDQLVEIAIRALSPAVNDTFTAMTCVDWLGDALCKLFATGVSDGVYRDGRGNVRLIEVALREERVLARAFDKVRQAGRGMPAIYIRQLENLAKISDYATTDQERQCVRREADMILRAAQASVPEPNDVSDVDQAHRQVLARLATLTAEDRRGTLPV